MKMRSRDSIVNKATSYGWATEVSEFRVPTKPRIFSFPRCPHRLWGLPSLRWVTGARNFICESHVSVDRPVCPSRDSNPYINILDTICAVFVKYMHTSRGYLRNHAFTNTCPTPRDILNRYTS
jgi:hypothetical protein